MSELSVKFDITELSSWHILRNAIHTSSFDRDADCVSISLATQPCSCGAAKQTMSHIVNDCSLSRFPGGLTTL